jgi:hypothetical protein
MRFIDLCLTILFVIIYIAINIDSTCIHYTCFTKDYYRLLNNTSLNAEDLGQNQARDKQECCDICVTQHNCTMWVFDGETCFHAHGVYWEDLILVQTNASLANFDEGIFIFGSQYPF